MDEMAGISDASTGIVTIGELDGVSCCRPASKRLSEVAEIKLIKIKSVATRAIAIPPRNCLLVDIY